MAQPNVSHHEIRLLDGVSEQTDVENMWKLEQWEHKVCDICLLFWVLQLTLRLLMSYIYGAPILDVSKSHTTTQHSR
jgi:hypothetical protein